MKNSKTKDEMLDVEAAPTATNDQLKQVSALSVRQIELKQDIAKKEGELGKLYEALKTNQETDLPEAMTNAGMETFTMTNGASVGIKKVVAASISKNNQPHAFAWLTSIKKESLIKRVITIEFGRDEETWAKKFMADMAKRKKKLKATVKMSVAPQTLGAFVREIDALPADDPDKLDLSKPFKGTAIEKLLGVFRLRKAEVTVKTDDLMV